MVCMSYLTVEVTLSTDVTPFEIGRNIQIERSYIKCNKMDCRKSNRFETLNDGRR